MKKLKGLSLIEVVITIIIIGILWVWVLLNSIQGTDIAKDSQRKADLQILSNAFLAYNYKYSEFPSLQTWTTIVYSWESLIIQWFVDSLLIQKLWLTQYPKDPQSNNNYIVWTLSTKMGYQIFSYTQDYYNKWSLSFITAWHQLWLIFDQSLSLTNTLSSIEILSNVNYNSILAPGSIISWTGSTLKSASPKYSCKRYKDSSISNLNWIYQIMQWTDWVIQVYCDMQFMGGGWTKYMFDWANANCKSQLTYWTNPFWYQTGLLLSSNLNGCAKLPEATISNLSFKEILVKNWQNRYAILSKVPLLNFSSLELLSTTSLANLNYLSDEWKSFSGVVNASYWPLFAQLNWNSTAYMRSSSNSDQWWLVQTTNALWIDNVWTWYGR